LSISTEIYKAVKEEQYKRHGNKEKIYQICPVLEKKEKAFSALSGGEQQMLLLVERNVHHPLK
jgi:ABC-type branched-subunit amino acid transport system ATPase component